MSAYVVFGVDVHDMTEFMKYVEAVTPLLAAHGAVNFMIDNDPIPLEGDWKPSRLVLHEFPSKAALKAFWDDPAYQPMKELRRSCSTSSAIVGEGPGVHPDTPRTR